MKHRKMNLTIQYVIVVCALLLVVNAVLGIVLIYQSRASVKKMTQQNMMDIADAAAAMLDADKLGAITASDAETHSEVAAALTLFQDNFNIIYIYTVRKIDDETFVFTVDPDPVAPAACGEEVTISPALRVAGTGKTAVDDKPVQDRWGNYYSAYSPVFDSHEQLAGIVGVDFDPEWYETQITSQTNTILVSSLISLGVGALIVVLLSGRIRKKLQTLARDISSLSGDVVDLTAEIAAASGAQNENEEKPAKESGDVLSSDAAFDELGENVHAMRQKLRGFIAYVHDQTSTDSMTGVGNRAAYLTLVNALNEQIEAGTAAFAIGVFDINGLKKTNDNYGHEYGDRIIIDAAAIIRQVFGKERVFRIGGDEFIAVQEGITLEEMRRRFGDVDRALKDFNENDRTYVVALSFSKGAAAFNAEEDAEFKDVFERADEDMYRDKEEHYRQAGDNRTYGDAK